LTYFDMVRAAVVSARLHAPSLAPYVIYLHRPNQPFRHDAFSCWLAAAGVRVVRHRLTFYDEMPPARRKRRGDIGTAHLNIGAYGRLDVPGLVSGPLAAELRQRGLDASRVLYTDTDVIFTADFTLAAEMRKAGSPLRSFAAGTEVFSPSMNSGVMLLNVSAFVAERRAAPLDRCAALRCCSHALLRPPQARDAALRRRTRLPLPGGRPVVDRRVLREASEPEHPSLARCVARRNVVTGTSTRGRARSARRPPPPPAGTAWPVT
jgi:hypothetical protein